jgi:hypothetical protein
MNEAHYLKRKSKYSEKTCPSTTNAAQPYPGIETWLPCLGSERLTAGALPWRTRRNVSELNFEEAGLEKFIYQTACFFRKQRL